MFQNISSRCGPILIVSTRTCHVFSAFLDLQISAKPDILAPKTPRFQTSALPAKK